jgi:hypothetical protein
MKTYLRGNAFGLSIFPTRNWIMYGGGVEGRRSGFGFGSGFALGIVGTLDLRRGEGTLSQQKQDMFGYRI